MSFQERGWGAAMWSVPQPCCSCINCEQRAVASSWSRQQHLKLLWTLVQWTVLLAYQIYSKSGLNSPGVLQVFDLAMNIFILGRFLPFYFSYSKCQFLYTVPLSSWSTCCGVSCFLPLPLQSFLPYILYPFVCLNRNMQIHSASNEVTPGWAGVFQVLLLSLLLTTILCYENLFIFWASSGFNIQNTIRISWSQPKSPVVRKSNILM